MTHQPILLMLLTPRYGARSFRESLEIGNTMNNSTILIMLIKCFIFFFVLFFSCAVASLISIPIVIVFNYSNIGFAMMTIMFLYPLIPISRGLLRIRPVQIGVVDKSVMFRNDIPWFFWCTATLLFYSLMMYAFWMGFADYYRLSAAGYKIICGVSLILIIVYYFIFLNIRSSNASRSHFSCLFLRRFGSQSEFSFFPMLLRSTPSGLHISMLIEQGVILRAWDLFTICFTPLFSIRVNSVCYFQGRDSDWEKNVENLASKARCIVMDVSDMSTSIHKEVAIIRRLSVEDKVVWLTTLSSDTCKNALSAYGINTNSRRVLSAVLATKSRSLWRVLLYFYGFAVALLPIRLVFEWAVGDENNIYFVLIWLGAAVCLAFYVGGRPRIDGYWKDRIQDRLRAELEMTLPVRGRFKSD